MWKLFRLHAVLHCLHMIHKYIDLYVSTSKYKIYICTYTQKSIHTLQKIYAQQIRNALVLLEPKASRCSMYNCISKHPS